MCAFEFRAAVGDLRHTESGKDLRMMKRMKWAASILVIDSTLAHLMKDFSKKTMNFAEMTVKHGFVHCDPHGANMMVQPLPSSKWNIFGE